MRGRGLLLWHDLQRELAVLQARVDALARDGRAEAITDLPLTAVLTRPDGVEHRRAVLQLVTRVLVVDAGRVLLDGPRDEVLERLRKGTGKPVAGVPA